MISSYTLIALVRRGELNFERFVEILSTRGYITEETNEEGCGFGSSAMEAARQEDFDALFTALLPGVLHNITLSRVATDEGGKPNAFAYALFNTNIIDSDDVLGILVEENRETNKWDESNT
jgi:hypothetical protein